MIRKVNDPEKIIELNTTQFTHETCGRHPITPAIFDFFFPRPGIGTRYGPVHCKPLAICLVIESALALHCLPVQ